MEKEITSEEDLNRSIEKMTQRLSLRREIKDLVERVRNGMYPPRNTTALEHRIRGYLEREDLHEQTRYILNHILKP